MFNHYQKGISLYLAVIIMAILLAIVLGLSTILFGQIRTIRGMGDSVIAFYHADTGIEGRLYIDKKCHEGNCEALGFVCKPSCSGIADQVFEDVNYKVIVSNNGTIFQSTGIYKEIKRAIEITF